MSLLTIAGLSPVKLAVMGGLWIVFMVLFFLMRKKSKEEEKKANEGQNAPSQSPQPTPSLTPSSAAAVSTAGQIAPSVPYIPPMVMIINIDSRPLLKQGEEVPNGYYLEVTPELDSTNRLIKLANEALPKPLSQQNNFVAVNDQEAKSLDVTGLDFKELPKLTPGTRVEPGYFIEIDLRDRSTDYIIKTERRLPPTQAKGFRWVRIQTRKLRK